MPDASTPADDTLVAGRYRILALLGQGGMGLVYRALDTQLEKEVALKTLRPEMAATPEILKRFKQEVKLAHRVTHPSVARTFDLGEHDDGYFLTMELVEGLSLAHAIRMQGALELSEVKRITRQIAEALSAAHAADVVHRDLKPDNVLIASDERVVLTDFGIATLGNTVATVGKIAGTPAYMSPEQVEARGAVDHRTDIYSLGAVAYEMLTGVAAWRGNNAFAVANARLTRDAPDPRVARAGIPDAWAVLVLRCMERAPEKRFATCLELADAVARLPASRSDAELADAKASPTMTIDAPAHGLGSDAPTPGAATASSGGASTSRVGDKTLAVLPFDNRGTADEAYLADGLTEDLTDVLSTNEALRVRPPGVVLALDAPGEDPRAAGHTLGVHVVVHGSVRKVGEHIQIRTRVISVDDGFQLWAKRFECATDAFFDISDTVARAVADALTVELETPEREGLAAQGAIEAYLRARHELRQSWYGDPARAVELFDEALALAPDEPLVVAGAAIARARTIALTIEWRDRDLRISKELAKRAVEIAGARPEAHYAIALIHQNRRDFGDAIRAVKEALRRNPDYAEAHDVLGKILMEIGPLERALEHLNTAVELEPALVTTSFEVAKAHALKGHWHTAKDLLSKRVVGRSDYWRQYIIRRLSAWPGGAGIAELVEPLSEPEPPWSAYRKPRLSARQQLEEIRKELANATNVRFRTLHRQVGAESLSSLGAHEECLQLVRDAVDDGLMDAVWIEHQPLLDPLRSRPEFEELRRRVEERVAPLRGA